MILGAVRTTGSHLLPFSSQYFMFSSINLTLFCLFCVGVKFGLLRQEKELDWGLVLAGW